MEAKIVDPITGEALFPGQKGELWLRGPTIMKGYLGDDKATAETIDSDGWLKTGDLCNFDSQSFLFIVGDVAFILSPHSLQIPILYFSLLSIGVIISPTNPDDSSSDITRQININKPVIVFTTSQSSHKLINGASNLINRRTVLIDSPEFLSLLTRYDENKYDVINHGNDVVNQSDVAVIIYSSGTTGPNKGVQLTHRNLIVVTIATARVYHPTDHDHDLYSSQPRPTRLVSLTTRSLAGVFGLTVMMRAVLQEETLVLLETPELQEILEAVDKYKANYMPVSPSDVVALLKSDSTSKYDLSSLIFLWCGGAPLSKEVAEKFRDKFPNVQILIGYGLTETGGTTAITKGPVEVTRLDSVGRLSEFMEAKILDPITGEALFPGQKGELWLRGPTIMKGYLGDDKATAETLDSEGWLKTGDLCYFDSQGFLFIVGRLKELIKYKAFQVPPAELEHLLLSNPEIVDAAVIPYPDEDVGQIPMAFVVRKLGSNITEAQVMEFTAKQVSPYKQVRRVSFINSIPKSHSGKILRRELVDRALSANFSTSS
ncbi:hypothetical protein LWI29_011253 [Acer saccharum]|uniref:4-coumarate--CoA ligase n=1 Tax=Acer saccharum TaxID=4024 RepID=A0AA39SPJ4_ACESA|nr:hypothetical protein LWI29_011253 [Acer saccharum]